MGNILRRCVRIRIDKGLVEAPLSTLRRAVKYLQDPLAEVAENEISNISNFKKGPIPELSNMIENAKRRRGEWIPSIKPQYKDARMIRNMRRKN